VDALTNSALPSGDVEKWPQAKVADAQDWRVKQKEGKTESGLRRETSTSCALLAWRCRQRTAGKTLRGKELAPQDGRRSEHANGTRRQN